MEQTAIFDTATEQFRLERIQTYNWGTFADVTDFRIARDGYLFVGPSGSGKSTVLDGHAALLTPPRWLNFNVAARENTRAAPDRNILTYVRGAWATQTNAAGDIAAQYLRSGTTWSAIVETYRNQAGRVVTVGMVLSIRGASTQPNDVKRLYLTSERELDMKDLEFFPLHDFDVRRFKTDLPDVTVHHEFRPYSERFRRLLGVENERALRLLHKTQSAKDLGDLNTFLREFMLDEPGTLDDAQRLVVEFDELNAAHKSVVAARHQADVLTPAQAKGEELADKSAQRDALREVQAGMEHYVERRRRDMLDAEQARLNVEAEGLRQRADAEATTEQHEQARLDEMRQRRLGLGGAALERLQAELAATNRALPARQKNRDLVAGACKALGWAVPDTAESFLQLVDQAKQHVNGADARDAQLEASKDEAKQLRQTAESDFKRLRAELEAMQSQRSNLPANLLTMRAALARSLGLAEQDLPFAGELLQVKEAHSEWRGAIERVLRGFAQSLLVEERYMADVAARVNAQHLNGLLVCIKLVPHLPSSARPSARSLVHKLDIAPGCPHADWLREELKAKFDYECVDDVADMRTLSRAVTKQGQVKRSANRFEKDDRHRVDDPRQWVLGFDNSAKRAVYEAEAHAAVEQIQALTKRLDGYATEQRCQRAELKHCDLLQNRTWEEIDVASLLLLVRDLEARIIKERDGNADLKALDEEIAAQQVALRQARDRLTDVQSSVKQVEAAIVQLVQRRQQSEREVSAGTESALQRERLDERFAKFELTWENIDARSKSVARALSEEIGAIEREMQELRHAIVNAFGEFNRRWPADAGGLDATMASAPDYFAKLERLRSDRLPEFEERFFKLLSDQSTQNLTMLRQHLIDERSSIRVRMDQVNVALAGCQFNPGTYLSIDTVDRALPEVSEFLVNLRDALSHATSVDREIAEQRFRVLQALVARLSSQEPVDVRWRETVLDVRQHVEFIARERDASGVEVEVYKSGAGKSGGQRQKLTATCLGAALRYQLGGEERGFPSFCTVVMDEAFDKADSEFTAMVMNIFREFGFQMVVATPMKSVMTLERFIGGACVVEIRDRKRSAAMFLDYDTTDRRLNLPKALRDEEAGAA